MVIIKPFLPNFISIFAQFKHLFLEKRLFINIEKSKRSKYFTNNIIIGEFVHHHR